MSNQNYDSGQAIGNLVFRFHEKEGYYVFVSPETRPGEYAKVMQGEIEHFKSKHIISANHSLIVLRDQLIRKLGGLDEVVRQIIEGTFKLEKNGGEQQ